MNRRVGRFAVSRSRQHYLFDQAAHDRLPIGGRGIRRSPQRRDIAGETGEHLSFGVVQRRRLLALEAVVRLIDPALLDQRLFPAFLQFAGHQTVLRLHGMILAECPVHFVLGALQALLPVSFEAILLLVQIRRCRQ
jgi:hypothetical protein